MPLINRKFWLKLKWTKYCVLSVGGANNADAKPNNIIFTIKDTKFYIPVVTLFAKYNQNYQSFLAKDFKNQFIGTNIKHKLRIKIQQINEEIFSNQTLLELIDYLY